CAPAGASARAWASTAPWSARTPTFMTPRARSPAPVRQGHVEGGDLEAGHRAAEAPADLGQYVGIVEVRGGGDDGPGAGGGPRALEEPRAADPGPGAELHDDSRVRGRGDPAGAEQGDRQAARAGDLLHERQRRLQALRPVELLRRVGLGQLADVAE